MENVSEIEEVKKTVKINIIYQITIAYDMYTVEKTKRNITDALNKNFRFFELQRKS